MIGYMTKQQAISTGFTNHGSYYGIPCWIRESDMMVATKWMPFEYLMTTFHYIEGFMNDMLGNEPSFMFKIGDKIV